MDKERSVGVTVFGWLFIGYFLYAVIYPLIYIIVVKPEVSSGPMGSYQLLKSLGVSNISLNLYTINGYIQLFIPLCSLIAGIGVLRMKSWARKFVLLSYGISLISSSIFLLVIQITPKLKTYAFQKQYDLLVYCLFIVFQIVVIYFFTRPKIKSSLNKEK